MVDLRRLTHEQLTRTVSSHFGAPNTAAAGTVQPASRYLSDPTAKPFHVDVYKPIRRAARPLPHTDPEPVLVATAGLEMTYADFITAARVTSRRTRAQIA
jgi:hypothetical protein